MPIDMPIDGEREDPAADRPTGQDGGPADAEAELLRILHDLDVANDYHPAPDEPTA